MKISNIPKETINKIFELRKQGLFEKDIGKLLGFSRIQIHQILNYEKLQKDKKEYRIKNKEKWDQYNKEYYQNNKKDLLNNVKDYYQENKQKVLDYQKEYRNKDENKDRLRRYFQEYKQNRSKVDASFRLANNLRRRINHALKNKTKSNHTINLIGLSVNEFRIWIELHWLPGMTWENYSPDGWHVDHIKPCALFDLSLEEQQKICFNYKNMQPLWATDNLSKWKHFKGSTE